MTASTGDPCPVGCGHPWHGLACTWQEGACRCPGPWGITREAYADMSSHYTPHATPEELRDPDPPAWVPAWHDREDELDAEETAALYRQQGRWQR